MRIRKMEPTDELFQEMVLDHSRNPRRFGRLTAPGILHGDACNPACGDEVEMWVQLAEDQHIEDISFTGQGCAISQAAASLLAVSVAGKSGADSMALVKEYDAMLAGADEGKNLGRLQILAAVRKFPARVACARVAVGAFRKALEQYPSGG